MYIPWSIGTLVTFFICLLNPNLADYHIYHIVLFFALTMISKSNILLPLRVGTGRFRLQLLPAVMMVVYVALTWLQVIEQRSGVFLELSLINAAFMDDNFQAKINQQKLRLQEKKEIFNQNNNNDVGELYEGYAARIQFCKDDFEAIKLVDAFERQLQMITNTNTYNKRINGTTATTTEM